MCDCVVCLHCTAPAVDDGLCTACGTGMHASAPKVLQKQSATKTAVATVKVATPVMMPSKTCFDCGSKARKIVARYGRHTGQEIWWCPTCHADIGLANH